MPRISLVIPAYNEEKYLGRTLASVLGAVEFYERERGGDVEVIVVDNNSTDKTAEVARRFGVRITPFKAKNQMAAVRNAGVKLAQGEILTFLDADSLVSKNVFVCVDEVLGSGEIIGGGVDIRPDSFLDSISNSLSGCSGSCAGV
ncbi:MAG: glycosyltransferase [Actinomycetota bacterium]|nr:glycosyltransferase [Actinomycetota bacterium]